MWTKFGDQHLTSLLRSRGIKAPCQVMVVPSPRRRDMLIFSLTKWTRSASRDIAIYVREKLLSSSKAGQACTSQWDNSFDLITATDQQDGQQTLDKTTRQS
ncbi:hypothetical protein RRG08_042533 [Elysia crispata]|uniref:Uncharacterized protein n=1 Tax=Elysia crispata TaxID=231223 RepID=A0AAE0XPT1_9GAST|nr:hypothetical protein RRG08_042533 [Elysia crispata]